MTIDDEVESSVYAAMHYLDKHRYTIEDFAESYNCFKTLVKLINQKDINPRFLLNYFIILCNAFALEAVIKILRSKIDIAIYPRLNSILVFLGLQPDATPVDESLLEQFRRL